VTDVLARLRALCPAGEIVLDAYRVIAPRKLIALLD
jgi:hypothetical protein